MTIGQWKNEIRTIVRMQSDRRPARRSDRLRFHRDLCPIPPFFECFDDFGVLDIQLPDTTQRIADDGALRRQLRLVADMLQLTTAAVIVDVVWAWRLDARGTRLDDLTHLGARKSAVPFKRALAHPHAIVRCGSRNEHDAAVTQSRDPITAGRDPRDRYNVAHSTPSRRPRRRLSCSHRESGRAGVRRSDPLAPLGAGCPTVRPRLSSATSAVATARARSSPGCGGVDSTRAPA